MSPRLYTRRGDTGTTSLASGERVSKACDEVEAYGTLDELGSHIGMLVTLVPDADKTILRAIQQNLFDAGSVLSASPKAAEMAARLDVEWLEKNIEAAASSNSSQMGERVSPTQSPHKGRNCCVPDGTLPHFGGAGGGLGFGFILPGGEQAAAWAHICRSICRRAERQICRLELPTDEGRKTLAFINRLSDYFFALAQKINKISGVEEIKVK